MNTKKGVPFSISHDNEAITGCTTSTVIWHTPFTTGTCFSLAPHTDISAETYGEDKLLHVLQGSIVISAPSMTAPVQMGQIILIPKHTPSPYRRRKGPCI